MRDLEFFTIQLEQLQPEENIIFPFHLYVYNPQNERSSIFLHANSPLTKEKLEFLLFIVNKGGEAAISINQKNTFLTNRNLKESEIESLQVIPEHEYIGRREKRLKEKEKKEETKGKFHFKEALSNASKTDNYLPLIRETRDEALTFDYTISHTVSLASYLAEKLLNEDNYINRITALAFQLAKGCGMNDQMALGDLLCASLMSHLGHTQMNLLYSQKAQLEMSDKERREYKKHPGLTQHLLKKSGLIISERCNKVIYQHHERFDGGGYPEFKQGQFIEPLALILGAAAHIMEYTSGKVTGSPVAMVSVVKNLKEKNLTPGLELEFGDTIYESLIYLLDTNKESSNDLAA